jgi:hypothetical protein
VFIAKVIVFSSYAGSKDVDRVEVLVSERHNPGVARNKGGWTVALASRLLAYRTDIEQVGLSGLASSLESIGNINNLSVSLGGCGTYKGTRVRMRVLFNQELHIRQ